MKDTQIKVSMYLHPQAPCIPTAHLEISRSDQGQFVQLAYAMFFSISYVLELSSLFAQTRWMATWSLFGKKENLTPTFSTSKVLFSN